MSKRLLRHRILQLHELAITAGLNRSALLSGIDKNFVAQLRRSDDASSQLLHDLDELNAIDELEDGTVPLVLWLQNAVYLAKSRPEGRKFEAVLRELDPGAVLPEMSAEPLPPQQGAAWRGHGGGQAPMGSPMGAQGFAPQAPQWQMPQPAGFSPPGSWQVECSDRSRSEMQLLPDGSIHGTRKYTWSPLPLRFAGKWGFDTLAQMLSVQGEIEGQPFGLQINFKAVQNGVFLGAGSDGCTYHFRRG